MADEKFSFDPYRAMSEQVDKAFTVEGGETAQVPDLGSLQLNLPTPTHQQTGYTDEFLTLVKNARGWAELLLQHYFKRDEKVPDLNSEVFVDVDFPRLETVYNHMQIIGWTPEVVFSQGGLDYEEWQNRLAKLVSTSANKGMSISCDNIEDWEEISGKAGWNISIMPSGVKPPITAVPHNIQSLQFNSALDEAKPDEKRALDLSDHLEPRELHPNVAAYLTVQAIRDILMSKPLDTNSDTWLHGPVDFEVHHNTVPAVYNAYNATYRRNATGSYILLERHNAARWGAGMRPTVVG